LNNHELFLSLPGGTGDLFKYNTGYFAGIPGGDANIDGVVDTLDFNLLAVNFAQSGKTWKQGDFTFVGVVDTIDFNVLAVNFGFRVTAGLPSAGGSVVPEPSCLFFLPLTALCMRRCRRRYPTDA